MRHVTFYIIDAFTQTRFAGNPAGVVLPNEPLSESEMIAIATELHLETAFALPLADGTADFRIAYYMGANRVPLCGHDTIALTAVLVHRGFMQTPGSVRLATDVGVLSIAVSDDEKITLALAPPQFGQTVVSYSVAEALGLSPSEIEGTDLPVQIVSTGLPFLIVPVMHRAALNALAPDMATLIAYGDSFESYVAGFYLWTPEVVSRDSQIHARCFCPALGLPEDPVTGTASGAVGAYLARHEWLTPNAEGVLKFRTEQGYEMGRPGNVDVKLDMVGRNVKGVEVSGFAVIVGEGRLRL